MSDIICSSADKPLEKFLEQVPADTIACRNFWRCYGDCISGAGQPNCGRMPSLSGSF